MTGFVFGCFLWQGSFVVIYGNWVHLWLFLVNGFIFGLFLVTVFMFGCFFVTGFIFDNNSHCGPN